MSVRLLQTLSTMSLAISVVVVICMAVSFAVLFFLYGKAKAKSIAFGAEDGRIRSDLIKLRDKCGQGVDCSRAIERSKKKERVFRIITDALLILFIVIVGGMAIFAFVLRSRGEQVYLGDTAYLTVVTGSMESKNQNNAYLKEHDDGVRISRGALIGIKKANAADLKEGDIIAFKYDSENIFVHRIVSIRESDGRRLFTTMGDGNDSSAIQETDITPDRIVGVYDGFQSEFLGAFLIYIRSDIGIVALVFVLFLLVVVDLSEYFVTRAYEKRRKTVADKLDGGTDAADAADAAETAETPEADRGAESSEVKGQTEAAVEGSAETAQGQSAAQDPDAQGQNAAQNPDAQNTAQDPDAQNTAQNTDADKSGGRINLSAILYRRDEARVVLDLSYTARLLRSSDDLKDMYRDIKNHILSYEKIRSSVGWKYESFIYSNKGGVVWLSVRGKTLCVKLRGSAKEYEKFGAKESGADNCMIRVKGTVTLSRAKKAISAAMEKAGAKKGERKFSYYYLPYRSEKSLLKNKLIRIQKPSKRQHDFSDKPRGDGDD